MPDDPPASPYSGRGLPRREDVPLVTGASRYVDDHAPEGLVHLAFVRSRYGHADLGAIDTAAAEAMPGVLAVYTWDDVEASPSPGRLPVANDSFDHPVPGHPLLATGRVRYHGQPVAAVVAEDRYVAHDAAAAVEVAYDRRPAVTDPKEATADDAPLLYDEVPGNVLVTGDQGDPEAAEAAMAAADTVVTLDLRNNRLIPNAMEPRGAMGEYDAESGRFTVTVGGQGAHRHRRNLAHTLGVEEDDVRVVLPHVGGGFGPKGYHYPGEAMVAWAARELDRPVKWVATRTEDYLAGGHGRDHVVRASLGLDDDGTMRALVVENWGNGGGCPLGSGAAIALRHDELLSGQYTLGAIHRRGHGVVTNTAPVVAYRGAGRPEAIYLLERLVDAAARELDLDPAELRRRNLIPPDAFPYETATGHVYDSGDYEATLDLALESVDYEALRAEQAERREAGELVGVGLAAFTESTGGRPETARVTVDEAGRIVIHAGTHSHGQGHETTFSQVMADTFGVTPEDVEVNEGDSDFLPSGTGTAGSRSMVSGGGAIETCAREVLEQARSVAAGLLEAAPEDVEIGDGAFHVVGSPDRAVSLEDVAAAAHDPDGPGDGLSHEERYTPDGTAFAFGTHVAVVSVDRDTGAVTVERYVAVDDCGPRINPTLVDGQVHGGLAQGLGQALLERPVYDDVGTLVSGSMMDYAVPRAHHLPEFELAETVTPSPTNPLGVKGIGEAGTIGAPPAIANAVADALAPLGVESVDMPMTDESVWRAMRDAGAGG